MKKSVSLFLIVTMLLAVSGCTGASLNQDICESTSTEPNMNIDDEFTFFGESESWVAMLKVDYDFIICDKDRKFQHDGDETSALYVTYKGDASDLESINTLRILCGEDSMENTYKNRHYSTGKTFKMPVSVGEVRKDDTIEVTVSVDDSLQTIVLKTSNNKDIFLKGNDDYTENHYIFKGESESWTGEMTVDSTLLFFERDGSLGCDTNEKQKMIVTYKGEISELGPVKTLKIDYDAPSGGCGVEKSFMNACPLQEKTYIMSSDDSDCSLVQENGVITVTVTIDGKSESFEMKNEA